MSDTTPQTGDRQVQRQRPAPSRRDRFGGYALEHLKASAPILAVLIVILVSIIFLNPAFLDPPVFLAFLRRTAPLIILALGQLFVIVSGGFDLSVGSLITVTVVVAAAVSAGDPDALIPVMALLLVIGLLVGLINGLIVTQLKVPSIITTLGMLLILRGAVFYWAGGSPTGALADNFRQFGREAFDLPLIGQLPYAVIVVVLVALIATRLLHHTTFGHQLLATGGGARAAVMTGVNIARIRVFAFVLSALSAVIAGILLGGFAGVSAQVGQGYEFQAISAVVLGGAAIGGGRGSAVATVVGALTLEALFMLLNLLGLPQPLRETVQGLILIGAVVYAGLRLQRAG